MRCPFCHKTKSAHQKIYAVQRKYAAYAAQIRRSRLDKYRKIPALPVEAGFVDNPSDNAKSDTQFNKIAQGIADGIPDTPDMGDLTETPLYRL